MVKGNILTPISHNFKCFEYGETRRQQSQYVQHLVPSVSIADIVQFTGRGGRSGQRDQRERVDYQELPKQNALYERYYNELGDVPEEEREEFWSALRRDLPNSFRFTGSKG